MIHKAMFINFVEDIGFVTFFSVFSGDVIGLKLALDKIRLSTTTCEKKCKCYHRQLTCTELFTTGS